MGYFTEYLEERDALSHHGVKGQKWGVRRFQDYSGKRIGGSAKQKTKTKNTKDTKTKKRPSHKDLYKDNSASQDLRGDAVAAVLGSWGLTAANTLANVGLGALGYISPKLLATNVLTLGMSAAYTGNLVAKDISASKANKKEKQFQEERSQNPVDKKTGFHKKTKEMTPDEDMERINPAYKNWDANTKNNCTLCTMAMELRRRGYDVQAKKATEGYDADTLAGDWFKGAKSKRAEGSMSDEQILQAYSLGMSPYIPHEQQRAMIANTVHEITKQPNGARGQMTLVWDGTVAGHSVAYENNNGTVVIYDTQANKKYEGKAAEKYMERCSQLNVTRLDNCEINTKYIKEVAE